MLARINFDGWRELKRLSAKIDVQRQDGGGAQRVSALERKGALAESRMFPKHRTAASRVSRGQDVFKSMKRCCVKRAKMKANARWPKVGYPYFVQALPSTPLSMIGSVN